MTKTQIIVWKGLEPHVIAATGYFCDVCNSQPPIIENLATKAWYCRECFVVEYKRALES